MININYTVPRLAKCPVLIRLVVGGSEGGALEFIYDLLTTSTVIASGTSSVGICRISFPASKSAIIKTCLLCGLMVCVGRRNVCEGASGQFGDASV